MRVRYSFGSRHTGNIDNISKQKKKFPDIMAEIISTSDIILEILDARFPVETRNLELEAKIERLGKKLIYVLNKSDLVDLDSRKKMVTDLGLNPHAFVSCRERKGVGILRERIKREAKRVVMPHEKMKRVQVGIVGLRPAVPTQPTQGICWPGYSEKRVPSARHSAWQGQSTR